MTGSKTLEKQDETWYYLEDQAGKIPQEKTKNTPIYNLTSKRFR